MADIDLLYEAWTVIANAGEGNWEKNETAEWREVAVRWRDKFHARLDQEPRPVENESPAIPSH
jgi:hypothetical protein